MSRYEGNIEKNAFNAASIAQARGATAKECLEIAVRYAMKVLTATWKDEIRCEKERLQREWCEKRELLCQQYAVIERENKYLHQLISDAKMFDAPPIILTKPID